MPAETAINSDTVPSRDPHLVSWQISADSTADFQSLLSTPGITAHSFFTSHGHKVREIRPVNFSKYQPDWILGILLLSFVLLAWVQVFYPRRLRQVMMAPYSRRFLSQLVRDGDLFSERIALAAGFIYVTTTSLFIFELFRITPESTNSIFPQGFLMFALISICILGFWILKIGLIRFLSFIFRTRQTTREYILNILIFNIVTGLFVLPFLVLTIYLKSDIFLWICIIIFILFFFFRFARGFLIGISITKFSWLFLFVYLCSLEILPLVVLIKVVLRYSL
ncbi:MAG: DUF4271 domain-containing protein [Bacteroidetes bacterium]|nr:DUF4271 domain-containing protein [Bacteroidota bacterium]